MKTKTSERQDPDEDDNEAEQQNLVSISNRIHKFQMITEIEIRVYQGAKEFGHQWIPFHQALDVQAHSGQ
jgi:hypothetical protein